MPWPTIERIVVILLWLVFLYITKKFVLQIINKVLDTFKSFLSEKHGRAPQKLNAALGFTLIVIILGSFAVFLYKIIEKDVISETLLVLFASCLLFFMPVLIFSERYTRHRYRKS